MNNLTLILGGARSGKSKLAVGLARKQCRRVAYMATAPICDEEMRERVKIHKKSRPKNWATIEVEKDLIPCLKKIPKSCNGVIIECIATYVSNLMMSGFNDREITRNIQAVLTSLKKINRKIFIVSNEVGSSLVPETASGRLFRDIVGNVNQIIAKYADEVYLVMAGLPVKLKC